jgi:uncharacterized protein (TIGR02466 family)
MATIIETEDDIASTLETPVDTNDVSLQVEYLFASSIWQAKAPQFLDSVTAVHKEVIAQRKKEAPEILKSVYPSIMSNNIHLDPRLTDFCNYINKTSWIILNNQGYNMDLFRTVIYECFSQEHHRYGGHNTHTHPGGQITGFYFVDTPPNSSRPIFQDPRAGKIHNNLPERDTNKATLASYEINYQPGPGDFIFSNSWLPHSFIHNSSTKPYKFIHFTVGVEIIPQL